MIKAYKSHTVIALKKYLTKIIKVVPPKKAKLNPDAHFLQLLGLPPYPLHLDPPGASEELLIVSAVAAGQIHHVPGFIHAALHVQTEASLLIHDLGLSRRDKETLNSMCNSTACQVSEFNFANWPNHVKDLKLQAFRPILIQLGLREAGTLLWMDIDTRIVATSMKPFLDKVKTSYILTWPEQPTTTTPQKETNAGGLTSGNLVGGGGLGVGNDPTPTTALTHPRMFEYFPQTQKEDYEFQHMISGKCLLLNLGEENLPKIVIENPPTNVNNSTKDDLETTQEQVSSSQGGGATEDISTPPLITSLMVPWLKCTLIEDCINPIGT